MVIYLEGPDGSGKTTLTKDIIEMCKVMSIPFKLAEPDICTNPTSKNRIDKDTLVVLFLNMLTDDTTCYILDRGPISDCIYRLFDNYKPVIQLAEFLNILRSYEHKILLVYCNNKDAKTYMLKRGDDNKIAIENHNNISYAYDTIMSLLFKYINYRDYDFTNKLSVSLAKYDISHTLKRHFGIKW